MQTSNRTDDDTGIDRDALLRLGSVVSGEFRSLSGAYGALRRASARCSGRAGTGLARLGAALQFADAFEQRLAHVLAASEVLPWSEPGSQGIGAAVVVAQLEAIGADLAEVASGIAMLRGELSARLGGEAEVSECLDGVEAVCQRLNGHARRLAELSAAAATVRCHRGMTADPGWMRRLYTMDAEREVHARVLASCLADPVSPS